MVRTILMRCTLFLFILIATIFAIEYFKDKPKTILNSVSIEKGEAEPGLPLPEEGEKLSYIMKYLWIIPVATAEVEVGEKEYYKNHRVYPLVARAGVSAIISRFIKAEGIIKSYVDVNKLYPWLYEENAQAEGHSPSNKVILYNQDSQIMEFEGIKRKIPENTQDPLSALFYLRWQEYEERKEISLNVNSNQENYILSTKLSGRSAHNIDGKIKNILIATSFIRSPKRYSKSEARIETFITDDSRRIPFLLKIRTKFGPLVIRLTDANYRIEAK